MSAVRRFRRTVGLVGVAIAVVGCGGGSAPAVSPGDIGHVHDLIPDGDSMLVASHRGLHRLENGRYRLVGGDVHDLMAMTELPGGDIIAGGHPDLRVERYRVAGAPSLLGLVRSDDAGSSWKIVGLLGEADFHALAPAGSGFYGADSTGAVWRFDRDGAGEPVGLIPFDVNDLAVSPSDGSALVASSYDGGLMVSDDAGRSWADVDGAPAMVEIEWTGGGLAGVDVDGVVWASPSSAGPYSSVGEVPGELDALLVTAAGETWSATRGGQIWKRRDDATWESMVDGAD